MDENKNPAQPPLDQPIEPAAIPPGQKLPRRSKKKMLIISLSILLIILLAFLAWWWFWGRGGDSDGSSGPSASEPADSTPATPGFNRIVVVSESLKVSTIDPTTDAVTTIYDDPATGNSPVCGEFLIDCIRWSDLSPDYSKIAMDHLDQAGEANIGYYDRSTNATTTLHTGFHPVWSPDGSKLAFWEEDGVKSLDIAAGTVTTIDSSSTGSGPFPAIYGWKSNTEIVFDIGYDDAEYHIGDITSGANTTVSVAALTPADSIRNIIISNDRSKFLVWLDEDPGYDAGVVNPDGSGYTSVSNNTAARWPGAGYDANAFAPSNDKVLLANNFIPADDSIARSAGSYEIHNLSGTLVDTFTDTSAVYRAYSTRACWFDANHIYVAYLLDADSDDFVGRYDVSAGTMAQLIPLDSAGAIATTISCAQ